MNDYRELKFLMRCINESMRLYPHPPVLIRRALKDDELQADGNKYVVRKGQDVIVVSTSCLARPSCSCELRY